MSSKDGLRLQKMSKVRIVSIISAGFSGSTLLDLILGSHPSTFSLGEVGQIDHYRNQPDRLCTCGDPVGSCQFWAECLKEFDNSLPLGSSHHENITDVSGNSIKGFFSRVGYRLSILSFAVLPVHRAPWLTKLVSPLLHKRRARILQLYDIVRRKCGKPILIDSSKSIHRFMLLHALSKNEAKAIFLTRDGRGRLASTLKRGGTDSERLVKEWRFGTKYALRLLKMLPDSAYLHIRHEEICRKPEETIKKICDFMEVPFDEGMVNFRNSDHHLVGGNRMRIGGIGNISEDSSWRTALTAEQLQLFEKLAGPFNRSLLGEYYKE